MLSVSGVYTNGEIVVAKKTLKLRNSVAVGITFTFGCGDYDSVLQTHLDPATANALQKVTKGSNMIALLCIALQR
jgi:hypothetical protein